MIEETFVNGGMRRPTLGDARAPSEHRLRYRHATTTVAPGAHLDTDGAAPGLGEIRNAAIEVDVPLLDAADRLFQVADGARRAVQRAALTCETDIVDPMSTGLSTASGRSVVTVASLKFDPYFREMIEPCLPSCPRPAFTASGMWSSSPVLVSP